MTTDYVIQVRIKNGPMLRALRASGYGTAANLSRACGVHQNRIGEYLNLRDTPLREDGNYREDILTIAAYLHSSPDDLFPPQHLRKKLACNTAEVDASLDDIANYIAPQNNGFRWLEQSEIKAKLGEAVKTIPARNRIAVEMRYGLNGNGEHTFEEVAAEIGGVTRERARQIILKGERLLRKKLSGRAGHLDLSAFD